MVLCLTDSSRPLWSLETASQYCCQWSHLNDLSAFWRPQYLAAHPSAFTIRLWQRSSNGAAFLFWRSLTSLKWQGKARGPACHSGPTPVWHLLPLTFNHCDFLFPTQALWFCSPARLRQVGSDECGSGSGRWKMMNGNNHTWPSVEAAQSCNTKKMITRGVLSNELLLYDVLYIYLFFTV